MSANQFKKYMNDVYMIDALSLGAIKNDEVDINLVFFDK